MPTLFCIAMYYLIMSLFFHRGHNLQFRRPEGSRHTVFYIWWPPLWCLKLTMLLISSNSSSQYVCVPTVDRTDPSIPISIWVFIFFCSYFIEGWHCSKMDRLARRISQGPQGPIQFSVSKQIKEKSVPQFNILLNWWCSTSTILSTLYVSLIRVSESKPRYFFLTMTAWL